MKTIKILSLLMLPLVALWSCSTDDDTVGGEVNRDKITFELISQAPIGEYPSEQVGYTFKVRYVHGVSAVYASLDGVEIENSRKEYEETPAEADYEFRYTLLPEQAGTTVDFVFTAVGADGYAYSIDYPVYVYAAQADIDITLPDNLAAEMSVTESLSFTVAIRSGITLEKIRTLKNGEEIVSATKTSGFTTSRTDNYAFAYTPSASDIGQSVTFSFEVTDSQGNMVSNGFTVNFFREPSTELHEYYNISVGFNKCTSFGPYLNAATSEVYTIAQGAAKCANIDILLFWSNNAATKGMAMTNATTVNAETIYGNAASVTGMGGTEDDVVTAWATRNATQFKKSTLSADEFAAIYTLSDVESAYENCTVTESGLANALKKDHVVLFKTAAGKCGALRVVSSGTANTSNAVIDYKIAK